MTVYIPENIDIPEFIKLNPTKNGDKINPDYLAYALSVVSSELEKGKRDIHKSRFVPVYSHLLKHLIGKHYNRYLSYLRRTNVLVRYKFYSEGHSRKYFFTPEYLVKCKPYKITYKNLRIKLEEHFEDKRRPAERCLPFLYKWVRAEKLSVDAIAATKLFPKKFQEKLNSLPPKRSKWTSEELANISLHCWQRSIDIIYKKEYKNYFTIGDGGGRLFTPITNISRDFRRFIKYDGQTLVHVDVSNSQPYFASLLLNTSFWTDAMLDSRQHARLSKKKENEGKMVRKKGAKNKYQINRNIKIKITYQSYHTLLMVLNSGESLAQQEFERYKKSVSSGTFYQKVADAFKTEQKLLNVETSDVKTWMFEVLFKENNFVEQWETKRTKLFKSLFPNIYRIFRAIKQGKHNTLALLLQNLESQAILHHACGSIARKHPKIPLFTIHDSIVTTKGYEGIVRDIMHQELEAFTGLPATLKTKVWDESYNE